MYKLLFLATCLASPGARAAPLTVDLQNVKSGGGPLVVLVFDSAEGFPKEARALRREILAEDARAVRIELPPGHYALMAYHDEDGNGVFTRRLGMFPAEGWGLSNNPKVLGKPGFDEAAFTLPDAPTTLILNLDY
jgi:uncharacterized protein (DUF2141 family)